ncbi:MAG: hypothetical protein RLZ84_355, partial [Actinomycetota bacterium]
VVTLQLTVNHPTTSSLSATVCAPATYDFNGQILASTGTYTSTLINAVGCDSVVTINLTVNHPTASSLSATICVPATYDFNGQILASTGTYTSTLINAVGCDSVVTLQLTVNQPTASSLSATICAPATYDYNGQTLGSTGSYTSMLINAVGCDSVVTINLTVNQPATSSLTADAPADRWIALLEAVAFSPVRSTVAPAAPAQIVTDELKATVQRLAVLIPQIAVLYGITADPKSPTPRPLRPTRPEKRAPRPRSKPNDRGPRQPRSDKPRSGKPEATSSPVERPDVSSVVDPEAQVDVTTIETASSDAIADSSTQED